MKTNIFKEIKTNNKVCFNEIIETTNIMKFLRKPYLAIFLASLTLLFSCTKYDGDFIESNSIDAISLKNIHHNIQLELSNSENNIKKSKTKEELEAEVLYLENVTYVNQHTIDELLIKNNLDTEII